MSHADGHVLLTWSCSYGNSAGSLGLCIQPVCVSVSVCVFVTDWCTVINKMQFIIFALTDKLSFSYLNVTIVCFSLLERSPCLDPSLFTLDKDLCSRLWIKQRPLRQVVSINVAVSQAVIKHFIMNQGGEAY